MKKVWLALSCLVLVFAVYYLFIRSFEYEVTFRAKTSPGDIIETIRLWDRSLPGAEVVGVDSFRRLEQTIVRDDRRYVYDWHFTPVSDSVTSVRVRISEPAEALMNKVAVPFVTRPIEEHASDIAREFYDVLQQHLAITRVRIVGEVEMESAFCVCSTLATTQVGKADGMMRDFPLLTSFVEQFNLKPDGPPIVSVSAWSHSGDSLRFDFCFPIARNATLPPTNTLAYKEIGGGKALKAEYYGNYITSDRAWYALIQFAEKHGYQAVPLPIERFHHNPNLGVSERTWKADVYLPLRDK